MWHAATVTYDRALGVYRARVPHLGQEMLLLPSLRARSPGSDRAPRVGAARSGLDLHAPASAG